MLYFNSLSRAFACLLVTGSVIFLSPPKALAKTKKEQAIDSIYASMQAAEQRYQAALIKIANNDPTGQGESDAAIEDMEDAMDACIKQKGCSVNAQMASFKRLLKTNADAETQVIAEEDLIDLDDPFPDHIDTRVFNPNAKLSAEAKNMLDDTGHRFDKMIDYNPAIQAAIRRWLTDMRPSLMASYENYQYLRPLMLPSFERAGLPEALLFGIMAKESNGKVHVTSRAGAAGPMQFMPATGRRFGIGPDGSGFDTRFDARAVGDASAAYLVERMQQLNNNIELSLAAYNGGEGRALRVYQATGGRSFWEADVYNQFPAETRDYVPMVIAAAWLYLHPKRYGLNFKVKDTKPSTIRLERANNLYGLTICLGSGDSREGYLRTLRNLNPRIQPDSWLPAGGTLNATARISELYKRYCVNGARVQLAENLMKSDPQTAIVRVGSVTNLPEAQPSQTSYVPGVGVVPTTVATGKPSKPKTVGKHKVKSGDTLVSISRQHSCDTGELARANNLKAPRYALKAGQVLTLKGCQAN